MIFCGDLSIPNMEIGKKLIKNIKDLNIFSDETVVINLEGVLLKEDPVSCFWRVYNSIIAIGIKDCCKQLIFNLANNHIYDYPEQIKQMISILNEHNIKFFGLRTENYLPLVIEDDNNIKYAMFGHCWRVYTKTNRNNKTKDRIIDLPYRKFVLLIRKYIKDHPDERVICCFHWNFDLEEMPLPMYKELARDLIDSGVYAVIGNHSHVVQQTEMYKEHVIAYGLGNFFMPDGFFFNGTLRYGETSHTTDILRILDDRCSIYRCRTDTPDNCLQLSGELEVGEIEYNKVNYRREYKRRRIKKLVPLFYSYKSHLCDVLEFLTVLKIRTVRFIKKTLDRIKMRNKV